MREKRRNWISNGRPRGCNNSSYNDYEQSKRLFRSQHIVCGENYLIEINAEIDQAAEVDSGFFWKKVNSRRQQSQTHAGSELCFGDKVCRDPEVFFRIFRSYILKATRQCSTLYLKMM